MAAAQASGLAIKVGPCISACVGSSDQNASNTFLSAIVAASGSVPPVSALDSVMMSGTTPAAWNANSDAGAAEAGKDLVEDQEQFVAIGGGAQRAQHLRIVKPHAAGALHQRLDDDGGKLVGVPLERGLEGGRACLVDRQIDRDLLGQQPRKAACMLPCGSDTAMAPVVSP